MNNAQLKVKQVKQILENSLINNEATTLRLIRSVIANDYGNITKTEAGRLTQVSRGFATCWDIRSKFDHTTQSLLNRGLLRYRLRGACKANDGQFTERVLSVTAAGRRALEAKKAVAY